MFSYPSLAPNLGLVHVLKSAAQNSKEDRGGCTAGLDAQMRGPLGQTAVLCPL